MAAYVKELEELEIDSENSSECNTLETIKDPKNYTAAMKTPQADNWKTAIESELKSLRDNRTWIVVPRPEGIKPLQSQFIFKLKLAADGSIERYKARLVARGDQQIEGVNYQETFSPVMDMTTARIILAFGVLWGNPPRHGDIPVAYTRAAPEENLEIYLIPPKGMTFTEEEAKNGGTSPILKLTKNIYGLKLAGRLWNQMLHEKLQELGYKQSNVDNCLYYMHTNSALILVGVYVDDLLVTSNNAKLVENFFTEMKAFDVKDLGTVEHFLGMMVEHRTAHSYTLSQCVMIQNLIDKYGLTSSKPVGTPIADVIPAAEDTRMLSSTETSEFRTLAGALLWITRCTRPDIGFAVQDRQTHFALLEWDQESQVDSA